MRRVLFVDDEPAVLDSLKLLLRRQRDTWDMVFVTSAAAALAELQRQPFDVIVTDMRMANVDGAQLLACIAECWPKTRRLVLSGYAETETFARVQKFAEQFLNKPCVKADLTAAIEGSRG